MLVDTEILLFHLYIIFPPINFFAITVYWEVFTFAKISQKWQFQLQIIHMGNIKCVAWQNLAKFNFATEQNL